MAVRRASERKNVSPQSTSYDEFGDDPITAEQFAGGMSDYDLRDFGFTLNRGRIRNFASGLGEDNLNSDESFTESTVGDYDINEDIYAAYFMGRMSIDDVTVDRWRAL